MGVCMGFTQIHMPEVVTMHLTTVVIADAAVV